MPREIKKSDCRVPIGDGAIFRYPYMSAWKLGATVDGKRLRPTLSPDKREALRLANEIISKARASSRVGAPDPELSIRQVVDEYLEFRRSQLPEAFRKRPREHRPYRIDEDRLNQIVAALPVTKASALRKAHGFRFVEQRMKEESKTNPKKTVGRTTANKPVLLLRAALHHACVREQIDTNPLAEIELPAPKSGEIRKKRRAMTTAEQTRFKVTAVEMDVQFAALYDNDRVPQAPLYLAIFESGRRLEEILSLEWLEVRLDAANPTWLFYETKGAKLTGDVEPEQYPIPPAIVAYLKALRVMHERILRRKPRRGDRVFVGAEFGRMTAENARRHFHKILKRAKIDRIDHRGRSVDLHSARMTVYARGAALGIPCDQMMTFVGHKDIRTAMRHYRDPRATDKRRIAEKLAGMKAG